MPRQNYQIGNAGEGSSIIDQMEILNAETYNDEAAVSIARSMTELARQRPGSDPHIFGMTGGFEAVTERRVNVPRVAAQRVEVKEMTKTRKARKARGANTGEDEDKGGRRRKKQKLSEDEDGDEDDGSKKSRGRPRLDTKDETAADRRRTQIRLAQRAYRYRKETTISSLETQVEKLQSTAEAMNNAFLGLYDFASSQGVLHREPDFARQLQATTQRVLELSKAAAADQSSHDDDSSHADEKDLDNQIAVVKPNSKRPKSETLSPPEKVIPILGRSAWGNDSPSHRDEDECSFQQTFNQMPLPNQLPVEGKINSLPNPDDDNFVCELTESDMDQLRAEASRMNPYQFNLGLGNDQVLTSPTSFASLETSFARRLHRTSNERGFRLLTNPHSNPLILKRVFGFSLLFRTKEQLLASLVEKLERSSSKGLLNLWSAPFVHVGGSGTYYPLPEEDISSNLMPKVRTGRSIGPLTTDAMSAREKHMIDNFTCSAEGFEGKYFDANDVESYLRGKGINIAPHTEYVTVNLDMISLEGMPAAPVPTNFSNGTSSSISPRTPLSPSAMGTSIGEQIPQTQTFEEVMEEIQMTIDFTSGSMYENAASNWAISTPPNLVNNNDGSNNSNNSKQPPALNAFDLRGPIFDAGPGKQSLDGYDNGSSSSTLNSLRLVTLSVATLVRHISREGVCLGRAPGFRPRDVDRALRRTIGEAFEY
ncbi:hypothetical protein GMDG_04247 [Pseudogymnoascus destructans 20631-21]|uniref:BZIP domain-containing protein n=1 Tax=Pseudogymnoascus destructans (strain ATCC MYA-4855 / 20631-21) TaxID=658429 RepID=L8GAT9_PSED2|nr:hypothetical protein GMDG_04247 [Pseudogymnoascus destructans 20631-21]